MAVRENGESQRKRTKVFISYSHDSEEHSKRVLELSDKLNKDGIDCDIDQYYEFGIGNWRRWMGFELQNSDFVIIIFTEAYSNMIKEKQGKGHGINLEYEFISQENYENFSINKRVIPVLFEETDSRFIPWRFRDTPHYCVNTDEGYEYLYRKLTKQPKAKKPEIGEIKILPPKNLKAKRSIMSEEDDSTFIRIHEIIRDKYDICSKQRFGGGLLSSSYRVYHKLLEEEHVLKVMDFDICMKIIEKSKINDNDKKVNFESRKENFVEKARFFNRFNRQPNIVNLNDMGTVSYKYEDDEYDVP